MFQFLPLVDNFQTFNVKSLQLFVRGQMAGRCVQKCARKARGMYRAMNGCVLIVGEGGAWTVRGCTWNTHTSLLSSSTAHTLTFTHTRSTCVRMAYWHCGEGVSGSRVALQNVGGELARSSLASVRWEIVRESMRGVLCSTSMCVYACVRLHRAKARTA